MKLRFAQFMEFLCFLTVVAMVWRKLGFEWALIASSSFVGITIGCEAAILKCLKAKEPGQPST